MLRGFNFMLTYTLSSYCVGVDIICL